MINVAIVEDDKEALERLLDCIKRYSDESGETFDAVSFRSAHDFYFSVGNCYDIVFLDIELDDGNGMDIAKNIRKTDSEVIIIFVTDFAKYAVKGYEVRAFEFIVKPVTYYAFSVKLRAALEFRASKLEKHILISNRDGKTRVATSRIKYVEIRSHTLIYHTVDGDYSSTGTLDKAESELKGLSFALCNRCYLVNLRYVTNIKDMSVFLGKEELLISHSKRATFLKALTDYCATGV